MKKSPSRAQVASPSKSNLSQLTLSQSTLSKLRNSAVEAAAAAGEILIKRFRTRLRVTEKPGAGVVTNADLEAEKAILKILKGDFPDFGVLAEESGLSASDRPGRWVIDPLDGTTNYSRGLPIFCVSIAAEWKQKPVVGVILQPITGELFWGVKGKGAFLGKKRMSVSSVSSLKDSLLTTGFAVAGRKDFSAENERFVRFSQATRTIRRPGAAALDLAYVASGVFDGFWERGLSPWDVAAGSLLVEEAGGKVTDFSGGSLDPASGEILCSNRKLHPQMLKLCRS